MVRMLSNFETPGKKLMHIVLSGQPQLAEKLASECLTQLRQRISILARLAPFTAAEARGYIEHRLSVAGAVSEKQLFSDKAYAMIAEQSGGIPRNINNLCFNSMSLACALQRTKVDALMVQEAINDLDLKAIVLPQASEVRHQSQPSTFFGATELYMRWRHGLGLAVKILISLVLVSVQMLRPNDRIPPQSPAGVSPQMTSTGYEASSIANVPAPQDAQGQNRPEEKTPPQTIPAAISMAQVLRPRTGGSESAALVVRASRPSIGSDRYAGLKSHGLLLSPQGLRRLLPSWMVGLSAPEQRLEKAHAAPKEDHVPFELARQREKP
jgi:hypothetical protein